MFSFVAFDIETTGISPDRDQIVEIGAVKFIEAKPVESFQSFVRIAGKIPPAAIKVHGITDSMLVGQPEIADILPDFTSFCSDCFLLAHNASFDTKFISKAAVLNSIPLPSRPILDSLPLARRAFPEMMNHRLDTLVKKLAINRENAHRASDDARACGQVFLMCLKTLMNGKEAIDGKKLISWCGAELKFPKIEPKARQLALF